RPYEVSSEGHCEANTPVVGSCGDAGCYDYLPIDMDDPNIQGCSWFGIGTRYRVSFEVSVMDGVRFLAADESREFFDEQAQRLMGISGSEFLARYDAGEYDDVIDDPDWHGKL